VAFGPSFATGTITAALATAPTGETITVDGLPLTPTAGARTSGSDDYNDTLVDAALINDIIEALNDPNNTFSGSIVAYRDAATNTLTVQAETGGTSGNSIGLAATGPTLTVSGATLTGGGVLDPVTIAFQAPAEDVLLKQLFIYSAADENPDFSRVLSLTSITVDGGTEHVVGSMPVPVVSSTTPASSPEWNIPVPAGGVVSIVVENLAPSTVLLTPTWTTAGSVSPAPPERTALGTTGALPFTSGADATATLTVGVAGLGDVLLFTGLNGDPVALTADTTQATGDLNFDVSSGIATTIAANIRTAINDNTAIGDSGFSVDTGEVGTTVTVTVSAGEFANTAFSITSHSPAIAASAFTGATDNFTTMTFPAASADSVLEQLFLLALGGEGAIDFTNVMEVNAITIDGGPNLIEGTISASMMASAGDGNSPRLDIPISAGQVVSVDLENAGVPVFVSGAWITRPQ
jgi:hypothetical protein